MLPADYGPEPTDSLDNRVNKIHILVWHALKSLVQNPTSGIPVNATVSANVNTTAEATAAQPSYTEGQDAPLSQTLAGALRVSEMPNASTTVATPTQATKTVAAAGTPERLAAATTLCESVLLEGKNARATNNTGNVFVGFSSANDSQLLMIGPGLSITLSAPAGKKLDLNQIWVDVATNADGITYTALN